MAVADRRDPFLAFQFAVELKGHVVAGFNEVTGISLELQVEPFREGGLNTHEQQLAGPNKFPTRLVLKHGLTNEESLWSWYEEVMQGKIRRASLAILLLDSATQATRGLEKKFEETLWDFAKWKKRWDFVDACPVKFTGPEFRASTAAVAFESIEFVHNGLLPMRGESAQARKAIFGN